MDVRILIFLSESLLLLVHVDLVDVFRSVFGLEGHILDLRVRSVGQSVGLVTGVEGGALILTWDVFAALVDSSDGRLLEIPLGVVEGGLSDIAGVLLVVLVGGERLLHLGLRIQCVLLRLGEEVIVLELLDGLLLVEGLVGLSVLGLVLHHVGVRVRFQVLGRGLDVLDFGRINEGERRGIIDLDLFSLRVVLVFVRVLEVIRVVGEVKVVEPVLVVIVVIVELLLLVRLVGLFLVVVVVVVHVRVLALGKEGLDFVVGGH